ncbi:uncharacterized protein SRS1_16288 [Sporisorium reilianum f. sp. reilianum]|uniref:Uncharacterized protein n=1 Tax=Sporisorium reilianum f. sp. reilianum TaxID=72559 RepID=A0A2N8ULI1_9BASI|nr:uncharacterized protein SRS1_16288 [Sporisorium reilianum f. sp. reilianum]
MQFYILMITPIPLHTPLDEQLVKNWFAFHYVQPSLSTPAAPSSSYATAFFFTGEKTAVLDVLLKAQFLMARVSVLSVDEYRVCLMRLSRESREVEEREDEEMDEGRVLDAGEWLADMRRDADDEDDEEEWDMDSYTTALEDDDMSVDGDSDSDSDDWIANTDHDDASKLPSASQTIVDANFLDRVNLELFEEWNLPASSSYGVLI